MAAEGHLRPVRRVVAPEGRHQSVRGDRSAALQHQQPEKLPQLGAAGLDPHAVVRDQLQRAQDGVSATPHRVRLGPTAGVVAQNWNTF